MERIVGVAQARAKLGQIVDEVATTDGPVVLTRLGEAIAVLVGPAEYEQLVETLRQAARRDLRLRLVQVR